jgi:hypothetical protein
MQFFHCRIRMRQTIRRDRCREPPFLLLNICLAGGYESQTTNKPLSQCHFLLVSSLMSCRAKCKPLWYCFINLITFVVLYEFYSIVDWSSFQNKQV